jgi:hypothetical protein
MFDQQEIDTLIKSTFHVTLGIQQESTDVNIELIKKSWDQISVETKNYIKDFLATEIQDHNSMIEVNGDSLMTNLGSISNAQKWIDFSVWTENN